MSEDTKRIIDTARREFERQTWKHANAKTGRSCCRYCSRLYDAGDLGFCVLKWSGQEWQNQWFDKAETLK